MRIATCINDLSLQLLGNQASVSIGRGWQGDLDQVIGINGAGRKETVADHLGHHLTQDNFEIASPARKRGPVAATPTTEE